MSDSHSDWSNQKSTQQRAENSKATRLKRRCSRSDAAYPSSQEDTQQMATESYENTSVNSLAASPKRRRSSGSNNNKSLSSSSLFDGLESFRNTSNSNSTSLLLLQGSSTSDDNASEATGSSRWGRRSSSTTTVPSLSTPCSSRSQLFPKQQQQQETLLAPATRMGVSDETQQQQQQQQQCTTYNSPNKTPQMSGSTSSSLFGAVMKHVQHDAPNSSSHSQQQPPPSTPTTTTSMFRQLVASPGGFQLLDFVNSVTSPFHMPPPTTPQLGHSSAGGGHPTPTSSTTTPSRRHSEWHSTTWNAATRQVLWMDWTLKSKLTFQCQHNNRDYNTTNASWLSYGDARIQQQAMMEFMMSGKGTTHTDPAVQWHQGLYYWQHPAVIPPPTSYSKKASHRPSLMTLEHHHDAAAAKQHGRQHQQQRRHSTNSLGRMDAKRMPPPLSSSNNNNTKTSSSKLPVRAKSHGGKTDSRRHYETTAAATNVVRFPDDSFQRQWQQAFWSLVTNWIQRVSDLAQQWAGSNPDDATTNSSMDNNALLPHQLADTYFYAVGTGHVVLFRVGLFQLGSSSCTDGSNEPPPQQHQHELVPEIVVSSSTLAVRSKLRAMGARWFLLERYNDVKGEFQEEMLATAAADGNMDATESSSSSNSPSIHKADIIALRRAQAFGQTAGADVAFSMQPTNGRRPVQRTPSRVPPLVLSGMDDCLAFSEVYLNALGQIDTNEPASWRLQNRSGQVPLLLCRKLGPFLHSTLNKATCLRHNNPNDGQPGNNNNTTNFTGDDTLDSFEVSGTLLPCAVRGLVSAVVHSVMNEAENSDTLSTAQAGSCKDDHASDGSSRHVVVQMTMQQTTQKVGVAGTAPGLIGDSSSKFLNGKSRLWEVAQSTNGSYQCCQYEEVVQTAVWDMERPDDLAYKLDHVSSIL